MLTPSVRGDLSLDGESENGGPRCNDVCAHGLERSVVGRKNPARAGARKLKRMAKRSRLANRMRGKRHKNPERLQKSQSQVETAKAGRAKGGPPEVTAATPEAIGEMGLGQ